MAVDSPNTKLLLHCDGVDASTTFIDEAGHTVTAVGNAQIDTAQSKFGGASGLFNGAGDYLTVPDSDDWQLDGGSNANEWTVDFWIRPTSVSVAHAFLGQTVDANNFWRYLYNNSLGGIQFRQKESGVNTIDLFWSWTPTVNTWAHIALVKQGTTGYKLFVNGSQNGAAQVDTTVMANFAQPLLVANAYGFAPPTGNLDEIRIVKGTAWWTSDFTPLSGPYGPVLFRRGLNGIGRSGVRSVL